MYSGGMVMEGMAEKGAKKMNTIYLDPAMVPAAMRGSYKGKSFKVSVCTETVIPMDAGLWSGGSRDNYYGLDLSTGQTKSLPMSQQAPWGSRREITVQLQPGFAVVNHSMFCGKDMGLTFYLHPENATKLLPAPVELSEHEKIVLDATAGLKSSYQGKDRYQMCAENAAYSCLSRGESKPFMSRAEWEATKQSLIGKGMLNKAGAITVKGRNAR